ncbi:MAG: pyridoxal-phosphate dependent enzyme [Ardenticatenales bacterium]|nr:pyridoxal-phosphate dependent enzyme [Ardenticatenales bacterium]
MRIAQSMAELIGQTPLLRLGRIAPHFDGELLAKLELWNPSGSEKDRVAQAMLAAAEADGTLRPGTVIIEATSGNIAFSLAMLAVPRGYHLVLVMPEAVPPWRVQLLRAMGAEVVMTPTSLGMAGAQAHATALTQSYPSVFRPEQFSNPLNPAAHERIAHELWEACEGRLAAVVVGVGTGGTVTGVGRHLKALSGGAVRVVAVEPAASPVLTGGEAGVHRLLGMGPPFIPATYDATVVDEVIAISDGSCHDTLLRLYRTEGLLSGPTGGAAIAAALQLAARPDFAGQRLVAIIPDSMERYTAMGFWRDEPLLMPTVSE